MLPRMPDAAVRGKSGAFRIWFEDRTLLTEVTGHFEDALIEPYLEAVTDWERRRSPGKLRSFHDWEQLDDYDMRVRFALTEWTLKHLRDFEKIHILTTSKLVQYGVAAANIVLRGLIVTYSERASFLRALAGR